MNGKGKLTVGCKVVALEDGEMIDADLSDVAAGMTFEYRGLSSFGTHEFGPDYDRYGRVGGLIGFQWPDDEMQDFHDWFRVLAPDQDSPAERLAALQSALGEAAKIVEAVGKGAAKNGDAAWSAKLHTLATNYAALAAEAP